jgi:ABC-type uncharacterized transport system fused permease/ATPase subunit
VTGKPFHSSSEKHENPDARLGNHVAWAFSLTLAIVAFVGAVVVLTIPYAVLSVSLPPQVNRLGLNVESTQSLFFGRPWYLLIPATLIALWTGYKAYRWCCSYETAPVSPTFDGEVAVESE